MNSYKGTVNINGDHEEPSVGEIKRVRNIWKSTMPTIKGLGKVIITSTHEK